ncbi:MAG: hypothetical protein ACRELE_08510 [Gemmatimonadales bacterium]
MADSDLMRQACSLTWMAIHQIAVGHAAYLGVNPADTSKVYASTVSQMLFQNLNGTPGEWYWVVVLDVHDLPHRISVNIEQLIDSATVGWAEQ